MSEVGSFREETLWIKLCWSFGVDFTFTNVFNTLGALFFSFFNYKKSYITMSSAQVNHAHEIFSKALV